MQVCFLVLLRYAYTHLFQCAEYDDREGHKRGQEILLVGRYPVRSIPAPAWRVIAEEQFTDCGVQYTHVNNPLIADAFVGVESPRLGDVKQHLPRLTNAPTDCPRLGQL